MANAKITTKVLNTERIELRTKDAKASYALTDVIEHIGDMVEIGHYVLYNLKESRCFDDQPRPSFYPVSQTQLEDAMKRAYIYFYKLDSVERYVLPGHCP